MQRPDIEALIERDLAALALLANLAQRRTPFGQGIRSGELLTQFAKGLREELDFRREADTMSEMALLLGDRSTVRVPAVYRQLSSRRVLVQERFEGVTVADIGRLDPATVDRAGVGGAAASLTIDQVMRIGVFHADPHPGNVFVLHGGELGLIDFGAVGRLDPIEQSAVVDVMFAVARRDVGLLRDGVERLADFAQATSPDELERALARLLAEHVRPGAGRPRRVRGARLHAVALRHAPVDRCRACCHGRWSPSMARCARWYPTWRSSPRAIGMVDRKDDHPSSIAGSWCAMSCCRCSRTCVVSPSGSIASSR